MGVRNASVHDGYSPAVFPQLLPFWDTQTGKHPLRVFFGFRERHLRITARDPS